MIGKKARGKKKWVANKKEKGSALTGSFCKLSREKESRRDGRGSRLTVRKKSTSSDKKGVRTSPTTNTSTIVEEEEGAET